MKKAIHSLFVLCLALSANAQYHSLLWKITGNDLTKPSYLYGTMHTADARVIDLSKRAQPYFKAAPAYAMELDPDKALNSMGLLSKLMMGKGYSLQKLIPGTEYRFIDSIVTAQVGFPMSMFDNVAPVFVMTIFESMSMGLSDSSGGQVLDLYFHDEAKKQKKKIIGIETAEEQIDALSALSFQDQVDLLVEEIDSFQANNNEAKDVLRYYLNQDLDSLSMFDADDKKPEKFYKALVSDRNIRMADRISGFIKKEPTFIAIGALHLPGTDGVIALLRKKGFTVEPVK